MEYHSISRPTAWIHLLIKASGGPWRNTKDNSMGWDPQETNNTVLQCNQTLSSSDNPHGPGLSKWFTWSMPIYQSTQELRQSATSPPVVWTRQDTWREIDVHCASCESGASGTAKPRGEEDGHLTIASNAFNIWELRATKINMKEDRFVLNTPTSCFASSRCLCMLLFPPTGYTNALCDNKINRIPPSCRPDSEFLARCLGHRMPASASMRYEIVSCSVAPCVMTLAECRDWMSEGPFDTITEYQLSGSLRRISHCKYVKPPSNNPKIMEK